MGKNKYIETPEQLWNLFQDYRNHNAANPIKTKDFVGQTGKEVFRERPAPLTFKGFECYLIDQGIINDLGAYERDRNRSYTDYSPIIKRIKAVCENDCFNGAAVGLYHANLIARKLGLIDGTHNLQEVRHTRQFSWHIDVDELPASTNIETRQITE